MRTIEQMDRHLRCRHLIPERYRAVWLAEGMATFGLWNLSGQLVGFQEYRPDKGKVRSHDVSRAHVRFNPHDQRYFTKITPGAVAVWGLETYVYGRELFVTEGIFDAARLHRLNLPAVAVLTRAPEHLRSWFKGLGCPLTTVIDGDGPGESLAAFGDLVARMPDGQDASSAPLPSLIHALSNRKKP